jgi:hypothetical protein
MLHAYGQAGICFCNFAESDEHECGQRFLDGSAPRLIRHVVFCETAGGGIEPLPAGKDKKLSREFEGRALIDALGAMRFHPASLSRIHARVTTTGQTSSEVLTRASAAAIAAYSGAI